MSNQLNNYLLYLYTIFSNYFRLVSGRGKVTALVRLLNDLTVADSRTSSILVLLNLTAAFKSIGHFLLLNRQSCRLDISAIVFAWFQLNLTNRAQFVSLGNVLLDTVPFRQGVPQRSVLGPIMFSIYMLPLGQKYGLMHHCYGDDTQINFITCSDFHSTISSMSECLKVIRKWVQCNFLKLNGSTTKITIGSLAAPSKPDGISLTVDFSTMHPSAQVQNLGVDPQLTFDAHTV